MKVWNSLIIFFFIVACQDDSETKKGVVTPELQRIASGSSALTSPSTSLTSVKVSSAITITSLKVPIRDITLTGAETALVYSCAANTNDGCLVELTGTALENLIESGQASIKEGTYTGVTIGTCRGEGSYTAQITASGTIPGNEGTYYTQSGTGELTQDESQSGASTVYFTGCSRNYPLPSPLVVTEGSPVTLELYFDITDIAFFGDGSDTNSASAAYAGGSSYEYDPNTPPSTTFVAVNYPDVAGTVDDGTPTIRRYLLTADTGGSVTQARLGFFYTSSGDYFGGYTRSYYSATATQAHNSFVTPIRIYDDNGDETFNVENYGSSATTSYIVIPNFSHSDHSGSLTIQGQAATYTAVADAEE